MQPGVVVIWEVKDAPEANPQVSLCLVCARKSTSDRNQVCGSVYLLLQVA